MSCVDTGRGPFVGRTSYGPADVGVFLGGARWDAAARSRCLRHRWPLSTPSSLSEPDPCQIAFSSWAQQPVLELQGAVG